MTFMSHNVGEKIEIMKVVGADDETIFQPKEIGDF